MVLVHAERNISVTRNEFFNWWKVEIWNLFYNLGRFSIL